MRAAPRTQDCTNTIKGLASAAGEAMLEVLAHTTAAPPVAKDIAVLDTVLKTDVITAQQGTS
jgi:hypothetical protein